MVAGTIAGLASLAAMAIYALLIDAGAPLLLPGAALLIASIILGTHTGTQRWLIPLVAVATAGFLLIGATCGLSQGWSWWDGALAAPAAFWLTTGLRSLDGIAISLAGLPLAAILADRPSGRLLLMASLSILASLLLKSYRNKRTG